jgi:formylglycine-generating enzyme required for sulfatase activity
VKEKRRWPVIALVVGIAVVGVAIVWIVRDRDAGPLPELPSTAMVAVSSATFEQGTREDELDAVREVCRVVDGRFDCDEELANIRGEEEPRTVVISAFQIDRHEVTVGAYAAWLERYPPAVYVETPDIQRTGDRFAVRAGRENHPVAGVTWESAHAYCAAVGKRLPTEAEWELAARGPQRRMFPWGSARPTCEGVVFGRREKRNCEHLAHSPEAVTSGATDVTPDGVHDLGGSVSEWTADAGGGRPHCSGPCRDPRVESGNTRVIRGGHWGGFGTWLRGAARDVGAPNDARTHVGFRCAR